MPKQKVTTLTSAVIDDLRRALSARNKSIHTVKAYCSDLTVFLSEVDGTTNPDVDIEELEELGMAWLTKHRKTLAPRTTARRLTSLREFAKWAGYPDMFADYNAPDGGDPVPHPLIEGMDGVRRMLAATDNEKQQCLIALCGMVGLRVAEALAVKPSDFIFQGAEDMIRLRVFGKGQVTRIVPVSTEAFNFIVKRYMRSVGTSMELVDLKDRFARRVITNLGERAKLSRRVASHDLRATFATAVYNKTKDQRLVQMLLGHRDGKTTEIYIGVSNERMREGVEGL